MTTTERKSPLAGLRVLDLTRVLAGPWCTQNLADLGAEVIKVERPGAGDDTRGWGPPYLRDGHRADTEDAAYFGAANRNKESIILDIGTAQGADVVRQLVSRCDILVENFKVGGLQKYGLDYESLKAINPALIYCSITGFGQTGPYASRPGYDFMIQGLGGLMSLTGEPGGEPQKAGVAVADVMTGMYATVAVLAAVLERHRSGLGQHLDIALLDCQVAMMANQNMNYLCTGQAPKRPGNAHQNLVPYQVFEASDGHLIVAVGNDAQFRSFAQELGHPEWADSPRFARNSGRVTHREELVPLLARVMLSRTRDNWLLALESAGIPAGPINTMEQVYQDPQVVARGLRLDLPTGQGGQLPSVASPLRLSATPVQYRSAPPRLGEHTREVLSRVLELSPDKVEALISGSGEQV
ncbi:CoA transferase [Alcaligenes pakistanensis]|uniref:CoA transferase n=1 Tax=Alcaligenes pakistanensis TaxID=1482717 RepID=A0A8H9IMD3_9BURK|nr:CaiB/BaiF CoA-transferase family protein [Alcaligenes pakistanensis]GHC42043.1 CoA transferase [Alcaligenes pakistanensis]